MIDEQTDVVGPRTRQTDGNGPEATGGIECADVHAGRNGIRHVGVRNGRIDIDRPFNQIEVDDRRL